LRRALDACLVALALLVAVPSLASHRVVDVQGKVLLQRKRPQGWAPPQPIRRPGVAVVSDDRIEVKSGSEALVRCASPGRRLWTVDPGGPFPVSRGCGADSILRLARREEGLPGGGDPRIPFLITPRASLVTGQPLTVRWNPVPGVAGYQLWLVRQRDRQLLWGARVVNSSSVALPPTAALVPGEAYVFVVEADDSTSSQLDPGASQQAFRRATPDEESRLARDLAALPLAKLDPEAAALVRADVQRSHGFLNDAIHTLEDSLRRHPASLSTLLELGQLYGAVGLNRWAMERYRQAAGLAAASDDPDALAEAQSGATSAQRRFQSGL
ncbi:MAG: hypothetical protein VKO44_01750, partial [Cyanobacteriota bacterium]|nr:hypothetical protein [Cyanobacteriota bacterium]